MNPDIINTFARAATICATINAEGKHGAVLFMYTTQGFDFDVYASKRIEENEEPVAHISLHVNTDSDFVGRTNEFLSMVERKYLPAPGLTSDQINAAIDARDGSEYDQRQGVPNE
jgi:hypothetical protein